MSGEPDNWCEKCYGLPYGHSAAYITLCHIAFWLVIHWPVPFGRIGFKLLPYAGEIAYSCHCYDKNRKARRP